MSSLYAENPRFALFGLGGIMMARLLPSLAIGPVAGVLADRYDRKRLMVAVDVARGVLFVFLAFADSLAALVTLTFAVECMSLLFLAAKDATLPVIVRREHLTEANQLNLLLAYGTLPLGAVIATAATTVLVGFGLESQDATVALLLINAATFLLAAALLARLHLPERPRVSEDVEHAPGVLEELREGARFIRDLPIVRSLILGVVGVSFGAGVVVTLGPQFVSTSLGRPETDWPRLMTAVGAGLAAGILSVPALARRFSMERLFPIALAATGAITAVMSALPNFGLALVLGAVLGAAAGISFVMGYTLLHSYTTDQVRGRTMAAFYTATRIALFTALGVAPFLASAISGSLFINRRYLLLSGIRITLFLGAMVALFAALSSMRGMYAALRAESQRGLHFAGLPEASRAGGVFVAFEGVEGAGKSTQVRALVEALRAEGRDVVVTREPGGSPVAERVREVLLDPNSDGMDARTETLLYAAARAEHVRRVVAPALEADRVVVCDRFVDSSLAYQGFARALGDSDVMEINRWAVAGVMPDVVVLLDLDADEGLRRVRARSSRLGAEVGRTGPRPLRLTEDEDWREQAAADRLEAEDVEFHRRVAGGYRELARRDRGRFVVVDAGADPATVARQVRAALHPWLPLPQPQRPDQPSEGQRRAGAGGAGPSGTAEGPR